MAYTDVVYKNIPAIQAQIPMKNRHAQHIYNLYAVHAPTIVNHSVLASLEKRCLKVQESESGMNFFS